MGWDLSFKKKRKQTGGSYRQDTEDVTEENPLPVRVVVAANDLGGLAQRGLPVQVVTLPDADSGRAGSWSGSEQRSGTWD
jgi:hypothetical protein